MSAPRPNELPPPPPEAEALSAELRARIQTEIEAAGGWLSFECFMELALYAPGLGYYSAGSTKLGPAGDFITAPEHSPLFGRCVARQVEELLATGVSEVLEIGGGSGALAAEVLQALATSSRIPERYSILEVSAELRERQRARIAAAVPALFERVRWIDALPSKTQTVVLANEVLDAMPVHVVRVHDDGIDELGVALAAGERFERQYRPATGELLSVAQTLRLPAGYETEINLRARAFTRALAASIDRGVALIIDYGYTRAEYYHPQQLRGTLMCHYRHRAHEDPLVLVGLQDITAHVDFTAIADAALESGMKVLGYTSQADFLVNCGIADMLSEADSANVRAYIPLAAQAQMLLSPAEMGERFKVLALGKGISLPLAGFTRGDRTHTL
ncbi:MAG: class I SAM-dependent methyltransferase [Burkholderiales bacterium]